MIFDSDVLIWRLRNNPAAAAAVGEVPLSARNLSAISYLELLRGRRNKDEFRLLRLSLTEHFGEIISVSEDISRSAAQFDGVSRLIQKATTV